jgi:hypothetical protein
MEQHVIQMVEDMLKEKKAKLEAEIARVSDSIQSFSYSSQDPDRYTSTIKKMTDEILTPASLELAELEKIEILTQTAKKGGSTLSEVMEAGLKAMRKEKTLKKD